MTILGNCAVGSTTIMISILNNANGSTNSIPDKLSITPFVNLDVWKYIL